MEHEWELENHYYDSCRIAHCHGSTTYILFYSDICSCGKPAPKKLRKVRNLINLFSSKRDEFLEFRKTGGTEVVKSENLF